METAIDDSAAGGTGAAARPTVEVAAAGEEAARGEEMGPERNMAARSSESDCMKASSFSCNCSTVNGSSIPWSLCLLDCCLASIDDSVLERNRSSEAIGRAKLDAYRLGRLRRSVVVSKRLCIPWFVFLWSDLCSSRACLNGCAAVTTTITRSTKHKERSGFDRAIVA